MLSSARKCAIGHYNYDELIFEVLSHHNTKGNIALSALRICRSLTEMDKQSIDDILSILAIDLKEIYGQEEYFDDCVVYILASVVLAIAEINSAISQDYEFCKYLQNKRFFLIKKAQYVDNPVFQTVEDEISNFIEKYIVK